MLLRAAPCRYSLRGSVRRMSSCLVPHNELLLRSDRRTDSSFQQFKELIDARFSLFASVALTAKEAGIKFFRKQRVLEAIHGPFENRDDHLNIDVIAQLTTLHAKTYECAPTVRILAHEKPVDLATQHEICSIVANQVNAIWDPVVAQHVLCAL